MEVAQGVTVGRDDHAGTAPLPCRIEDRQHAAAGLGHDGDPLRLGRQDFGRRLAADCRAVPATRDRNQAQQEKTDSMDFHLINLRFPRSRWSPAPKLPCESTISTNRRTPETSRLIGRGSLVFPLPARRIQQRLAVAEDLQADVAQRADVVVDAGHRLQAAELAGQGPGQFAAAAQGQTLAVDLPVDPQRLRFEILVAADPRELQAAGKFLSGDGEGIGREGLRIGFQVAQVDDLAAGEVDLGDLIEPAAGRAAAGRGEIDLVFARASARRPPSASRPNRRSYRGAPAWRPPWRGNKSGRRSSPA